MLQNIDETLNESQAIILAHTRELADQIHNVVKNLSSYMRVKINLLRRWSFC